MSKILYILAIFTLLFSTTFANFGIETKLSEKKQENFQRQIDSIFQRYENKLEKLSEEKQKQNLQKVSHKIEIALKTQKNEVAVFALLYLQYILEEKLEILSVNFWWLLEFDEEEKETIKQEENKEKNPVVVYIPTNTGSTTPSTTSCSSWYHLEGNTCVSNTKSCSVSNWSWTEQWTWTNWTECNFTCNSNFHKEWGSCTSNTQSFEVQNGRWERTWDGNTYWNETISCNSKYTLSKDELSCEKVYINISYYSNIIEDTVVIDANFWTSLIWKKNVSVYWAEIKTNLKNYTLNKIVMKNVYNNNYWEAFATLAEIATKGISSDTLVFEIWKPRQSFYINVDFSNNAQKNFTLDLESIEIQSGDSIFWIDDVTLIKK